MITNYIPRYLEEIIKKWLFQNKALVIYGARRVGKTTLIKNLLEKYKEDAVYYNCDLSEVKRVLRTQNHITMKSFIGAKKLVVFDEAQQVPEIGLSLKILYDIYPEMQIIATGSSSFDLANKIGEPLTGRSLTFSLYPFSISELETIYNRFEIISQIENFLIYGMYPGVVLSATENRPLFLKNLADNYLYKDVLAFENLKKPDLLLDLLRALALQVGSEVSINELSVKLGSGAKTIRHYLDLLEKSFVIFRLRPLSRNLRNEIGKKFKVYFYDLGVRNALIERFASLEKRDDVGMLWENFCVVERIKRNQQKGLFCNMYFWRDHSGKEVDYLEERNGEITAFEFKWKSDKYRPPKDFLLSYKVKEVKLINRDNFLEFVI